MDSLTFLVVDDSATIRQLLTLTLRKFNSGSHLKIIEATDGVMNVFAGEQRHKI